MVVPVCTHSHERAHGRKRQERIPEHGDRQADGDGQGGHRGRVDRRTDDGHPGERPADGGRALRVAVAADRDDQVGLHVVSHRHTGLNMLRRRVLTELVEERAVHSHALERHDPRRRMPCLHDPGIAHHQRPRGAEFPRQFPEPPQCVGPDNKPRGDAELKGFQGLCGW